MNQRFGEKSMHDYDETYKYDQITYLQDFKRNTNFSYLQSMVLIAGFLAGSNKESGDCKMFEVDKSKQRSKQNANKALDEKGGTHLVGKTKRFVVDRLAAIVDYLTSLEIEGADECKRLNHSAEFHACINSLVKEDLLKKTTFRTGGSSVATSTGGDDLIHIGYKCNFDQNFVFEVAEKINFPINEYLHRGEDED
jgi:hypothetical protein